IPCALMGGGNHQVLAAKKYAMIAVNIQTTGASSIDSHLLYAVPVPSTASDGGTKLSHSIKYVQLRLCFLFTAPKIRARRVIRYGRIREINQRVSRVAGLRVVGRRRRVPGGAGPAPGIYRHRQQRE